jgi:Tol biopolymer transport system component
MFFVTSAILAVLYFGAAPPPAEIVRFEFVPAGPVTMAPSLSPDGRHIAFQVPVERGEGSEVHIRAMDSFESWPVQGTVGVAGNIFWSNDSRSLYFKSHGKLRKVDPFAGTAPQSLADVSGFLAAGVATSDGLLLYGTAGSGGGIWSVPEAGGDPKRLTLPDAGNYAHVPVGVLPDRRHFLYWSGSTTGNLRLGLIDAAPEDQGTISLLACEPSPAYVFAADIGYLLYTSDGWLLVRQFDPSRRTFRGDAVQVAEGVTRGGREFTASPDALVYLTGDRPQSRIVRFDRAGKRLATIGDPGNYEGVSVSPNDRILALSNFASGEAPHLWIVDPARETFTRLNTGDEPDFAAEISPDELVAFTYHDANLYLRPASGAGEPELLVDTQWAKHANDWSPDGRWLIYDEHEPNRRQDLYVVDMQGDRAPIPFLVTDADETVAQFSPDGKWILYASDESGRYEVYGRDFAPDRVPAHGDKKLQISVNGGDKPRWSMDGNEIYYFEKGRKLMAVEVSRGTSLRVGIPRELFEVETRGFIPYDVIGQNEFIVNVAPTEESGPPPPIAVVLNWRGELRR